MELRYLPTRHLSRALHLSDGRLDILHIVAGQPAGQAALLAVTVVERGLITRLDHAAYLGRELAKAEISIKTGALYEQDAALGSLPLVEQRVVAGGSCSCASCDNCNTCT